MKVFMTDYDGLVEAEKENVSDNGGGKEYANYIVIDDNGDRSIYSDAMEPEDARFSRDLSWVLDELKNHPYYLNALDKAIALIVQDGADGFWCPQSMKYGARILDAADQVDGYNANNTWLWPECRHCCNETNQPEAVVTACYKRWFMSEESDQS